MHGSWVISRGEKKLLTCSLYEERTRWKRGQFFVKFDFSIGLIIIVETNKKVELFPWTGEVQTVIWIAKCINTFFATEIEKNSRRLVGINAENGEINEGLVRFDIVFYVRVPLSMDGRKNELSQIIINVEAQKDEPNEYKILNRAIFYVSRLISSQKERDFENSSYDDIKRVYSIWVCMNMDKDTMSHVHLIKEDVIGTYEWKGKLDLINIIMVGLAKKLPGHSETDY